MGLFGLSLYQESAPQLGLSVAGSWKPPQWAGKAALCVRVGSMGLQAKPWHECLPASTMGEGAQRRFLFSCQSHGVPSKGERVGQGAENIMSLQFGQSQNTAVSIMAGLEG